MRKCKLQNKQTKLPETVVKSYILTIVELEETFSSTFARVQRKLERETIHEKKVRQFLQRV